MADEYVFDDVTTKTKKSAMAGIGEFIWNSRTKEFCGRDGASWGKVSLFYAIFYACLGSFFVGMLAVFVAVMPKDKPTYYGESSTMSVRGLNPGLGFRPQIDVEDSLIMYKPNVYDDPKFGHKKLVDNLNIFLDAKYPSSSDSDALKCASNTSYVADFQEGRTCDFDYEKIFKDTQCSRSNNFGYKTTTPCVLIKLNKIISWTPESASGAVEIKCAGETSSDRDNILKITYHSEDHLNDATAGYLDRKYFPFMGQKTYKAPFVFVQFEVKSDVLVNVECKAYAVNIDNTDRLNRRGQTKFSIFVGSPN